MKTYETLTAKRLRLAMKPLNLPGWMERYPTMFNGRISAILGESKWETNEYSLSQGLMDAVFLLVETKYILQDRKWK